MKERDGLLAGKKHQTVVSLSMWFWLGKIKKYFSSEEQLGRSRGQRYYCWIILIVNYFGFTFTGKKSGWAFQQFPQKIRDLKQNIWKHSLSFIGIFFLILL